MKKVLTTPVSRAALESLSIGDVIYLSGKITTCRDVAHRRVVEYGQALPVDVREGAILHAGPIVRAWSGGYEMISVGPTTSMRMEKFERDFIRQTGVRVIVGKGGMGPETAEACREFGTIHCVFPAGCAVVAASEVEKIEDAQWLELGMPETLWTCCIF